MFTKFLISLTILSIFFFFFFSWFLSSTKHIVDTFWFTIIIVCVCFRKTHNPVFSTTYYSFMGSKMWLVNKSYHLYQVLFANGPFFIISFSSSLFISSIDALISLRNSSSIFLLIFIYLYYNSLKCFSNSKMLFSAFRSLYFRIMFKFFISERSFL